MMDFRKKVLCFIVFFRIIRIFAPTIYFWTINYTPMAKYNLTEKREKDAAYRSLVNPLLMDELKERILDMVLIQQKYKDKDYSARRLAEDLGTNTRYISAVVNVRFHVNYTTFVNKFRVDEAMSLLSDRRYSKLNMEEISDIVGFANRQSFYASFYKFVGMTPREFKLQSLAKLPPEPKQKKKRGRKSKKDDQS